MTTQPALNEMGNRLIRLDAVATRFVDVFRECDGGLDGLQCVEAEALADMLRAVGGQRGEEAATNVIRTHAAGDDDEHGDTDPSHMHHDLWHEINDDAWCELGEECPTIRPDTADDEINRRKEAHDG